MLKSRKLICLMTAVVLLLSVMLSGCGTKDTAEPATTAASDTTVQEESTATTEPAKIDTSERVELTWYFWGDPKPDDEMVMEEAQKIINKEINADLKMIMIPYGNYNDRLKVMSAAGDPYDLCFTSSWLNPYKDNVLKGAYIPMDELLDKYAPKLKALVPAPFWDATRVDGKIYAAINYQISTSTRGVGLKKELVDKYNFDVSQVKEQKDLEPFLKLIKENEKGIYPIESMIGLWSTEQFTKGLLNDISIFDDSLKVISVAESPEYKECVELARKWYLAGYIRNDALSIKDEEPERKAGKYAVITGSNLKPGAAAEFKAKYGYEIVPVYLAEPVLEEGSVIATMNAISTTSENPERAMMLLELLNTNVELYNMMSFGLEGIHYKKVEGTQNRIELTENANARFGFPNWAIGTVLNSYLLPGQEDDVWQKTHENNMSAKASPLMGFSFNREALASQVTSVESVIKEFATALETGSVDPAEFLPKYIEKLKSAGNDEILAEKQKQIDAWKATKK